MAILFLWGSADNALGRSAYNPRHSGLEPPGGPHPLEAIPGRSPSRTAEGGMGYKDAYGNTVQAPAPEDPGPRKRLKPGAYGAFSGSREDGKLPEVKETSPVWNFR